MPEQPELRARQQLERGVDPALTLGLTNVAFEAHRRDGQACR
jgi:hypothetical protein